MKWNKNHTALTLIFGSLLLLLVFLSKWVHSAYVSEKEALEKELNYNFRDVASAIEDSLIHKIFFNHVNINIEGTKSGFVSFNKKMAITLDTMHSFSPPYHWQQDIHKTDTSMQMIVQTIDDTIAHHKMHSLLPLLINWHPDSLMVEVDIEKNAENAVELIRQRFDHSILNSDLPKTYEIKDIGSNNKDSLDGLWVNVYDIPDQDKLYVASFSNYFPYLLQKIKHNILFALVLFFAIAFSFYMIYTNWREQQKLIEIKNDFISNVTHELKTPISTVSVALEALSRFDVIDDRAKTKEYLKISKQELKRLRILVDKVLKMSIFEKGASKFQLEKLDFNNLLDEVLSSMKIQFEKSNSVVNKELVGDDFSTKADKIHMTNVIYNLLDNAIKYSNGNPEINIRLEEENGTIDLYIQDNGIGIPMEEHSKIFQRFYRVPTGDLHNVKGHGLGLSYVASVIEEHNGTIHLESNLDRGSTFHIKLSKGDAQN